MERKIAAGVAGGLGAGLVFAIVMRVVPGANGSMITFAARAVHLGRPLAGWLAYLVYGGLIGGFFAWLLRDQRLDDMSAMVWGALYGLGWWIVAGLILVPVGEGSWPFSTMAIDQAREVALPLLIGHVVYGGVLGLAWSAITRRTLIRRHPDATHVTGRRAA
jgi:hypothetical protein